MNDLLSTFSPEAQLLLCCAQVHPNGSVEARIDSLLDQTIDWSTVSEYAERNEVEPLVHRNLSPRSERVPDDVLAHLANTSREIAVKNLSSERTLRQIIDELEEASIPVIPFKGPTLAHTAYGNTAFRQYVDLDLLVKRNDFFRAKALLQASGYEPCRSMEGAEEAEFVDSKLGYELVHPERGAVVELHWAFFYDIYRINLDPAEIWRRHEWDSFCEQPVRSLAPEDLLLYLCIHGTKHRFLKLKWLCDVAEFVRAKSNVDWDVVQARAQAAGTERMFLLSVSLASDLLGADVPRSLLLQARADSTLKALADKLCSDWLLRDPERSLGSPWEIFWFHFREREHLRDRVPFLWHHVKLAMQPSDQDREWIDLPAALSFLYIFVRPIRLFREWMSGNVSNQALSQ